MQLWISRVINVNFYQILVHVTVSFRNLIFVCVTINKKLIKHIYNSHVLPSSLLFHSKKKKKKLETKTRPKTVRPMLKSGSFRPYLPSPHGYVDGC